MLGTILAAISQHRTLGIAYAGKARIVSPIAVEGGIVRCFCLHRREVRSFRLDRITDARLGRPLETYGPDSLGEPVEIQMLTEMKIPEYPKIETLFDRNKETFRVDVTKDRLPEFGVIDHWRVTEKVDGTNIRVAWLPGGKVWFGGRTDAAQMPARIMAYLQATFTAERMGLALQSNGDRIEPVVLYGEGYGPTIQKGGGLYRSDVSFRLFDVRVGRWWLRWSDVEEIAARLGIRTVPCFGVMNRNSAIALVSRRSLTAEQDGGAGCDHEGIVARSEPLLLTRSGDRVMWKLKAKDF